MNLISGINATASALQAEKIRLNVIAENIANAHTTRDANGGVYRRKTVSFEALLDKNAGSTVGSFRPRLVNVAGIDQDPTAGRLIYNPNHPHADEKGMVEFPNVEMSREMVDLISASRAYEANLSVIRTAREMAQQTLSIGRR